MTSLKSKSNRKILIVFLIVILVVFVIIAKNFLFKQPVMIAQPIINTLSSQKGLPFVSQVNEDFIRENENFILSIYNLSSKSINQIGLIDDTNSEAVASPDLMYTVYVDNKYGLYILYNGTLKKQLITTVDENSKVGIWWSPDSKKFIFSIRGLPTFGLIPRAYAMEITPEFYLFDIQSKKIVALDQDLDFRFDMESFIDTNHILIRPVGDSDRLAILNIKSLETKEIGRGFDNIDQINVSKDGELWSFSRSGIGNSFAEIVFAEFPNKDGIVIEKGGFADFQLPKIASDSKNIAYQKVDTREKIEGEGFIQKEVVWIYNVSKNSKKRYLAGIPELWLDNETLLVRLFDFKTEKEDYFLLNIRSGQIEKLKVN